MPIETELKISEDIDAILIKIHNEGYTGSNEHDLHIREEIVDYIKKVSQPHPSEREVLMRFIEWMYLVYGTPLNEKTIDTYLAEKQSKTEKK